MSTPEARCVWLTHEQRDWIAGRNWASTVPMGIVRAWDAAPADPVEAAARALRLADTDYARGAPSFNDQDARAVLVALGYPDGSPRQETTTPEEKAL